jgi:hypothetical protein
LTGDFTKEREGTMSGLSKFCKLALIVIAPLLIVGCGSVEYANIHQDIKLEPDLSGAVSQTFTLTESNYSLLFNQYSGDVLKGHAQDLAQALGWEAYEVKTWDEGGDYFIELSSTFASAQELSQMLAPAGQELDIRAVDGVFSSKYGFVSTARIGRVQAETLTVSLKLPGSVAFSNGQAGEDGVLEWNLSQDSRLMAISASLVEYDAFAQINFKAKESGTLIVGVVAPEANIKEAGSFYGGLSPAQAVGNRISEQAGLKGARVSDKSADGLTWVYVSKDFGNAEELSALVEGLSLFKSLDFQSSGDNFRLDYVLNAELYPFSAGLGNPNHLTFSAHLPGKVGYSNGTAQVDEALVWEFSDSEAVAVSATSNEPNTVSIRRFAGAGVGGLSLLIGLAGVATLLFSLKPARPKARLAGAGVMGLAGLGVCATVGVLASTTVTLSNPAVYLPTPGPSVQYVFDPSVPATGGGGGGATVGGAGRVCSDGFYDPSGQCWASLDSANTYGSDLYGLYDPANTDSDGDGIADEYDSNDDSAYGTDSGNSYDPNDYDGDGVGNWFDNDPNYYNPPGDFDYGVQDP